MVVVVISARMYLAVQSLLRPTCCRTRRKHTRKQIRMSYREYRRERHRWCVLCCQSIFTEHRRHDTHLRRHGRSAAGVFIADCRIHILDVFRLRRDDCGYGLIPLHQRIVHRFSFKCCFPFNCFSQIHWVILLFRLFFAKTKRLNRSLQ